MSDKNLSKCSGFEWDKWNLEKIWGKHKVTPFECEQIFFNRPLIVDFDEAHSQKETRLYILGQTDTGRELFAVFTIRKSLIRIVSARDMSRQEKEVYGNHEEQNP